jgi:hypothetical protein
VSHCLARKLVLNIRAMFTNQRMVVVTPGSQKTRKKIPKQIALLRVFPQTTHVLIVKMAKGGISQLRELN